MITDEAKPLITKPVMLNVGSGQRKFGEGWTNIDIQERWKPDIVADCSNLSMFPDRSVDMVVAQHNLEHFTLEDGKRFIRECYRLLKYRGSLIITVPDLRQLTDAWIRGRIPDYIFCVNLHGAYMGDQADIHKWSFTDVTLKDHITSCAPWWGVIPFDWRPIPGADISKDWWILGVESIK